MPDQEMIEFVKNFSSAREKMRGGLEANTQVLLTVAEVRAVVDWMHAASSPQVRAMVSVMTLSDLEAMVQKVVGS